MANHSSPEAASSSTLFRKYRVVFIATGIAALFGGFLMVFGRLLEPHSHFAADMVEEAGKVVFVTSLVGLLFEFVMHDRFVQRVKEQVASVEDQVVRLDTSIEHLQRTVAITSGAIESGLSAVYSDRQQTIDEIGGLLETANRDDELRLVGISLGDFLCPHGRLFGRIAAALASGVSVKALLLNMDSDAAKTRAQREESDRSTPPFGSPEWEIWYHETRCYDELKTASDVARAYTAKFGNSSQGDGSLNHGRFECKTYELSPLCFLAIMGSTMFLESYHYAGRGGEAPILKIAEKTSGTGKSSRLFEIYARHFEVLWKLATPLPKSALEVSPPLRGVTTEPGPAEDEGSAVIQVPRIESPLDA